MTSFISSCAKLLLTHFYLKISQEKSQDVHFSKSNQEATIEVSPEQVSLRNYTYTSPISGMGSTDFFPVRKII